MNEGCRKALMISDGAIKTGMMVLPGLGALGSLGKASSALNGGAGAAEGAAGGGTSAASGAAIAAKGGPGGIGSLIGSLMGSNPDQGPSDQTMPFKVGDLEAQRQAALAPIDFGADMAEDAYNRKPPKRIFS